MSGNPHILVVDDEAGVRDLISGYLGEEGFRVTEADGGDAFRRAVDSDLPDLVILDLKLPGEDGLALCRWLRDRAAGVGIIILTGKGGAVDRVVGLEMGADDYVAKPFDLRELLARVRSVLRRTSEAKAATAAPTPTIEQPRNQVGFAGWTFDLDGRVLTAPEGNEVALTTAEFSLLATFIGRPNHVFNRDQLVAAVNNRDWEPFDRSIDVLVMRLRRKIEKDSQAPELIKTVRGAGYIFTAKVQRL